MIIDQSEHLRIWLSQVLQPLCDADPNALAKYVLALIRKDKEEDELKQCMIDQLDVFLQLETKGFVSRLFKVLKTKEYLPGAKSSAMDVDTTCDADDESSKMDGVSLSYGSSVGTLSSTGSLSSDISDASRVSIFSSDLSSPVSDEELAAITKALNDDLKSNTTSSCSRSSSRNLSKKETEDRERDRSRKNKSRSPRRSRSRSRGREPRDYRGRYRGGRSTQKRYERDVWDRRRSPGARNRSASPRRSPPRYRRPYNSRSRSRTPPLRDGKESVATRFVDQKVQDNKDIKPVVQSVIQTAGVDGKNDSPGPKDDYTVRGIRCRDYDEKGLCMRGDLCPYDHGINPVILEDVVGGSALKDEYQVDMPVGYPPRIMRTRAMFGEPSLVDNIGWGPQPFRPRHMLMMGRSTVRPVMMRFPPPRLLVDVPVVRPPVPQPQDIGNIDMSLRGMPRNINPSRGFYTALGRGRGRGGFDRGRLGAKPTRNNCSLEVKKIPREQNTIMELNSHFWKFGKIINIQINFDNDPEAALVTFATPEQAYAAYKATEAVMNNRFIRVFWHNKEKENEDEVEAAPGTTHVSIKDRLGEQSDPVVEKMESSEKIIISGNNLTKTVYNFVPTYKKEISAERAEQVEAIKKSQEMLAAQENLRKAHEEQKKEAIKLMNNLKIRKGDILREQLEQQKKLIFKLEENKLAMSKAEKDQLMDLIRSLQDSIESIKKDLDELSKPAATSSVRNKTETQKQILDAELDLYNKEIEGGDTMALQHKVYELRAHARATGVYKRGRGGYRGSRGFSARGSRGGGMRNLRSVDRRTTKICITGYPVSRHSEVLNHFGQFGPIESFDPDLNTPSLLISYAGRKTAEVAMSNGKVFDGMTLDVQWVAKCTATPIVKHDHIKNGEMSSLPDEVEASGSTEDDESEMYPDQDQMGLYDQYEEEEDDEVERSWRR